MSKEQPTMGQLRYANVAALTARVVELEAALRLIAASIISADHAAEYMRGVARAALANTASK